MDETQPIKISQLPKASKVTKSTILPGVNGGTTEQVTAGQIAALAETIEGPAGPQGPQGPQGEPGPAGAQGEAGPAGPQGEQGEKGDPGETGPQGPQGERGEAGAGLQITGEVDTYEDLPTDLTAADAGKAYIVKDEGNLYVWSGEKFPAKGTGTEFVGPQGPKGDKGDTGDTGPQGEVGPIGPEGPQGPAGPQGEPGEQGPQGDPGPKGETGPQGPEGPQGPAGSDASVDIAQTTGDSTTSVMSQSATTTGLNQAQAALENEATERERGITELATQIQNDLEDYYTKSQTDALVSAIPKFAIEVVDALPTENISETTVYLVPTEGDTTNLYTEYIYVNNTWEELGQQKVDLTDYYTKDEINAAFIAQSSIVQATGDSTTTVMSQSAVTEALNTKQDTLTYATAAQVQAAWEAGYGTN